MGHIHKRQKKIIVCNPKRSCFITIFFQLQFDQATSSNLELRLLEVALSKMELKTDLLYRFLYAHTILQ